MTVVVSNPVVHKWHAVRLFGMKQLFTMVTHSFWRQSQLIRVRRLRRPRFCGAAEGPAIRAPGRIQPIFNISWRATDNTPTVVGVLPMVLLHYSLFDTKLCPARYTLDLNIALMTPPKVRIEREARSFLCFPLRKSLRAAALADDHSANLPQIRSFRLNNTDFHIHYWTQAFSFPCCYKCLIFTLRLSWIFTWFLFVAAWCSY